MVNWKISYLNNWTSEFRGRRPSINQGLLYYQLLVAAKSKKIFRPDRLRGYLSTNLQATKKKNVTHIKLLVSAKILGKYFPTKPVNIVQILENRRILRLFFILLNRYTKRVPKCIKLTSTILQLCANMCWSANLTKVWNLWAKKYPAYFCDSAQ